MNFHPVWLLLLVNILDLNPFKKRKTSNSNHLYTNVLLGRNWHFSGTKFWLYFWHMYWLCSYWSLMSQKQLVQKRKQAARKWNEMWKGYSCFTLVFFSNFCNFHRQVTRFCSLPLEHSNIFNFPGFDFWTTLFYFSLQFVNQEKVLKLPFKFTSSGTSNSIYGCLIFPKK